MRKNQKKRKKKRKDSKADINHILHYNMGVCLHRLTTFHSIAVVIRPGRKDPAFSFVLCYRQDLYLLKVIVFN